MIANDWMVWFIQHDRHHREGKEEAGAICISEDGHTQIGNFQSLKPGT
jgi:hypothetical protein